MSIFLSISPEKLLVVGMAPFALLWRVMAKKWVIVLSDVVPKTQISDIRIINIHFWFAHNIMR